MAIRNLNFQIIVYTVILYRSIALFYQFFSSFQSREVVCCVSSYSSMVIIGISATLKDAVPIAVWPLKEDRVK